MQRYKKAQLVLTRSVSSTAKHTKRQNYETNSSTTHTHI